MSHSLKSIAAIAAVAMIAGCSGGGSSPTAPVAKTNPGTSSGTPSTTSGKATGSLKVTIKARSSAKRFAIGSRKPNYISPATSGIFATFVSNVATPTPTPSSSAAPTSPPTGAARKRADASPSPGPTATPTASASATPAGTTTQGYTLAPNQTASASSPATCGATASDGSFQCTLYFSLSPTGSPYQITLTAYDSAQSGTTLTAGTALSTDTEIQTVAANESNSFDFALQGIIGGFNVSPQYVGVSQGTPMIGDATATFTALDPDFYEIDSVDTSTNFAVGTGPNDLNASFAVATIDKNLCHTPPCVGSTSTAVTGPASEGVDYSYSGNGSPGNGTTQAPYYGVVALTAPADYSGFVSLVDTGVNYAGTLYVVPLFGLVDPTSPYADAASSSTVDFTASGKTVTAYAAQYALPTSATGYSVDDSACSAESIASVDQTTLVANPANPGYGDEFTITSGTAPGPCTITISDGGGDTASITVNNTSTTSNDITVPTPGPTFSPNAKKRH